MRTIKVDQCQIVSREKYCIKVDRACKLSKGLDRLIESASSVAGTAIGQFYFKYRPKNPEIEWRMEVSEKVGSYPRYGLELPEEYTYHVLIEVVIWFDGECS